MKRIDTKTVADGKSVMTVQLLGSGWAAVEMWCNDLHEDDLPTFWEPYQTGIGRYATKAEALVEAEHWAESDGFDIDEDAYKPEESKP